MADKLITCVFQHQALFYEQDANCKNNNLEENIWRCIVDHLGQLELLLCPLR